MTNEPPDDEMLFERLQQATAGNGAARQLRRRYEVLREDYERLIDRLGELEGRLEASERTPSGTVTAGAPASLAESILQPLVRLRDEYATALASMQGIVSGLNSLAAGAFKGQRGANDTRQPPEPAHATEREHPRTVQVDVKGRGFGALLDFQEQLSALSGVGRVSIHAIDNDRASLLVELER
ncbi:MAG: hypothetical protein ACR2HN_11565 [Tepidiformaceae bacterium]